jgi:hypothetical protein
MADALLQFWQQQLTIYQAEQNAAHSDLAKEHAALQAASTKLAADQKSFDKVGADVAAARAKLAATTVPADANALIAKITQMIITQRGLQGTILDDNDKLAEVQASLDSATATLARAGTKVASVQATITAVTADASRRDMYKTAIASAPLATLHDDSTAFKDNSDTVKRAKKRIETNFPSVKLLAIETKRHDTRVTWLENLKTDLANSLDALATEQGSDGGLAGAVAQTLIGFQRAQDALAKYVATAANRFTKAKAVMAALEAIELDKTGTVPDILTAAEQAQLTALTPKGEAAEATADALDTDMNKVFTAHEALQTQILASITANVDTLSTDHDIAAKRTDLGAAWTTFNSELSAFAAAGKNDLDQWEAVVPDAAWKVLLDYNDALATLNYLSITDPAALGTALNTAETEYVTALGKANIAQRRIDYFGDAIAIRRERLDSAQAAIAARMLSAVRGDSY